jgi:succinate dehydrogenase flavin-adding protein (antitoxin of CptAB toxin-antitoxin module)
MNSLVKFVKPHRRIDLYEKWKSLRGIKVDFENLYKPYLKEVYRYENNNGKQLESLMNDEDKVIFNIDMSKMPCKS